ncbi:MULTISPECIES: CPBP family intramembrane glutamic endopeptidase [unclassified Corynebacterium]|uniref:CPBP family intramembrane glutamic endopeptidase n=1 Tax=unclassified Corynebacterium TaxID=2624378 RepID=UPI002653BD49|nr:MULTISPECIES: type II CAAX endopeptidase family protein [unclassified Corynebacterium]MDN8594920.1 type II CAAX endopeptidase family protein [Corynebacterium sp. P4_F2]WKK56442.1 type II CAAX endopeptidase family protein [Corynebacterium sp. P4-C1]WKK63875.1 type II CAAX endopeptidase family protein [Corynebacterium sp. P8-C1]
MTSRAVHPWLVLVPCVLGALGLFFARQAGDGTAGFYALTVVTAVVYAAAWWIWGDRYAWANLKGADLARGIGIGAALAVVFLVGAVVVRRIPFLAEPVSALLSMPAAGGWVPTLAVLVINGIGEELVYRDAVPRQLRRRFSELGTGVASTLIYCIVTVAMGVPLLVFAAGVLGAVCFVEASRTGKVVSPIAAHLTWSITMLAAMPLVLQ